MISDAQAADIAAHVRRNASAVQTFPPGRTIGGASIAEQHAAIAQHGVTGLVDHVAGASRSEL